MARAEVKCLFCGDVPQDKNLEHILPKWLIKHTGDLNRNVFHGLHMGDGPSKIRPKIFSFDKFRFPVCETCNSMWSDIENQAKSAIISIENESPMLEAQISTLFDWFDKVRVGLWFARQVDGSSIAKIDPKFAVNQRVGASDRLLYISSGAESRGLTSIGVGGAVFAFMPSVFALRINKLMFFNASSLGLFSHRLGFPKIYDRRIRIDDQWRYGVSVNPGSECFSHPLMHMKYPVRSLKLYQPMYRYMAHHHLWGPKYSSEFVLNNSLDWNLGEGGIFCEKDGTIERVSELTASHYERARVYQGSNLPRRVSDSVGLWQRQISKQGVRGDIDTPDRRLAYMKTLADARRIDKMLAGSFRKSKSMPKS